MEIIYNAFATKHAAQPVGSYMLVLSTAVREQISWEKSYAIPSLTTELGAVSFHITSFQSLQMAGSWLMSCVRPYPQSIQ